MLHYKALSPVQRALRSLKSVDLRIRSIHHRLADRMRARRCAKPMAPGPNQSYLIDS